MRIAVIMALTLSVFIATVLVSRTVTGLLAPPQITPVCEEDMPCWDCTTMGNRICGHKL
jgi:hypothetical protein